MNIQTIIMSRGEPPCRPLALWLSENFLDWRYGSQDYGIDHARNQNIRRFLREDVSAGKTHLLSIDADMVPVESTAEILTEPGELLYCGYVDRFGSRGHIGQGDFGAACFRASAELLARMGDQWFEMGYHNGKRIACECSYFHNIAQQAGGRSRQVGVIGHQQTCVLVPAETETGWILQWPQV
ncbi:MAG: hypothetical protein WCJ35_18425 [Planctomycetota bacterium]